ncbi:MAG: hypothetical protein ACREQ9_24515 [Candidatus Binatia bacterium]
MSVGSVIAVEHELRQLFALNVLLHLFDGFITYQAVGLGFAEGNPLLQSAFATIGVGPALLLFKAEACGWTLLLRRSIPPALGIFTLRWIAVAHVLLAIVPWTGFFLPLAAM